MPLTQQNIFNKDTFIILLILILTINLTCCNMNRVGVGDVVCLTDHRNISYIDIKKRFARTFHDFTPRQLRFQDFMSVSRVSNLELRFVVEHVEHVEHFELNRFKDTDSHEYFFIRRVLVVHI